MEYTPTLAVRSWGYGDRSALLLHGQLGSSESWADVGPLIADRGYQVLAVDLPGHGQSTSDPNATVDTTVAQLTQLCSQPALAIGHSLGGLILAHAAGRLGLERAVFVDAPLSYRFSLPIEEYQDHLSEIVAARTLDELAERRPEWTEADREREARAASQFDIATSVALMRSLSVESQPTYPQGSLVVVPKPSRQLSTDHLAVLRAGGVRVEEIEGAGHTVWYGDVPRFMRTIEAWL